MLKKNPHPTFTAPVKIPVPGETPETLIFTFRHKSKSQLKRFWEECKENNIKDEEAIHEIVSGWNWADVEFSKEALVELIDNYPGAALAIIDGYSEGLHRGKVGN